MAFELSPDELHFQLPSGGANAMWLSDARMLTITNHNIHPIAFRIKTTAPKHFRVQPPVGIVEGGGYVDVRVNMVGVGSTEEEVSASFVTPPRFLVQSVLVVRGMEGFDPFSKWAPGDFPERQVHLRKMKVRVVDKDGAKLALKQRHRKGTANLNDGELGDGPLVVQDEMGVDGIAGSPPPAYRVPAVALGGNGGGGGADGTASVVVGSLESQGAVMTRPSTGVTKVGGMDSRRGSLGRKGKYVDVGVQTDREREGEGELPPLPVETSLSPPTVTVESDAGKSEGALVGRSNKNVSASFVGRLFQKVLCSGAQTNYLT